SDLPCVKSADAGGVQCADDSSMVGENSAATLFEQRAAAGSGEEPKEIDSSIDKRETEEDHGPCWPFGEDVEWKGQFATPLVADRRREACEGDDACRDHRSHSEW